MNTLRKLRALVAGLVLAPALVAQVPSVIRVEIDYMEDSQHSHRPPQAVIDAAVRMFACHGITLQVVISEAIPHLNIMRCNSSGTGSFFDCIGPDSFLLLKNAYADQGNLPGWHYCIFGHQYNVGGTLGSSGYGEGSGDDFVVTLGTFSGGTGTLFDMAGTFVHELGHNLGLGHKSPSTIFSSGPNAPNYASVMSYQYQLTGVRTQMENMGLVSSAHLFKDLDYSNGRLPDLNESSLVEAEGTGIRAVDWSCNGAVSGTVSVDLDGQSSWCGAGSGFSRLDDFDDWANIRDYSAFASVHRGTAPLVSEVCMTSDELRELTELTQLRSGPASGGAEGAGVVLSTEACRSGEMYFTDTSGVSGNGRGDSPFGSLGQALGATPNNGVLYFKAGSYTASGGTITIDRPVTLASPGTAVIRP